MMNSADCFMPGPAIKSNGGIECDLMLASNEPPSREDAPRHLRLTSDHLLAGFSTIGCSMQEYLRLSNFAILSFNENIQNCLVCAYCCKLVASGAGREGKGCIYLVNRWYIH